MIKVKLYQKCSHFFLASGGENKAGKVEGSDKDEDGGIGALAEMLDNLDSFVVEPTPQGAVVKCRITRDRKGMDRGELDYQTLKIKLKKAVSLKSLGCSLSYF